MWESVSECEREREREKEREREIERGVLKVAPKPFGDLIKR